ncbi:hydroxymethylbilane synthase [Caldilinea sp.]|uniref:hydroxymethylbilane synthase n=1 Tax=Caldilinea sp. TaxID=2293560 RepID=UPI002C927680|nr:hydroxymethylbilane synthase [Anaerolineales bacterium]HQY93141.1 hydroxymethylbilane synthase [Caldilinea sp.]HRA66384.1 hydroxymethylbilane synthase [Caldilinea sp.]
MNERASVAHTVDAPALRLGTRGSALARWQTDYIAGLLAAAWPDLVTEVEILHTQGDRILDKPLPLIGGKGLFTAELEAALHRGAIDLAVHSLKDLPTEQPPGLMLGAIPARAAVHDVAISRSGLTLAQLPRGAVVGTSSRRRAAQLLHAYPHLRTADIRGNIDTRIKKALDPDGPYDAILLALAGVARLGHREVVTEVLPLDIMLPAPGQGALAVQCRADVAVLHLLAPLDDAATRAAVTAERAFLRGLGGGCSTPVAAYAEIYPQGLHLRGRVAARDGAHFIDVTGYAALEAADELGASLAAQALSQGARQWLAEDAA